jgi:hypothetical protein
MPTPGRYLRESMLSAYYCRHLPSLVVSIFVAVVCSCRHFYACPKNKLKYQWPTPGRYLRESMLSALTRCVENVDESDFAELVNSHSFPSSKRLNKDEEDEIVRQVITLFNEDRSRGQRQEEEDDEEEDDTIEEVEKEE